MEHFSPKVSIIIPVYNGVNYLTEAIDSALAQTYKNIEILVINDGSNDNGQTEAIAEGYGNKIRYISKSNGGVASALNLGIAKMTGDYFSWLSHDDLYLNTKIETQIKTLAALNNPRAVLYGDYSVFTTDPDKDILCKMKGVSPFQFRHWITFENCLHGCTLLIPKIAFQECGLFNEQLRTTQDYDMWFRIAKVFPFVHCSEHLVKARSHIEQDSLKKKDIVLDECNQLLSNFVKQLSLTEIQQASMCSSGLGYAQLASSMWYRGFFPAGRTSAYLSLINSFQAPLKEIMLAQCILMKGFLLHYMVKPMRKLFSPYSRRNIKQFLTRFSSFTKNVDRSYATPAQNASIDHLKEMNLADKFSTVYENNLFGGNISRSGEGSDLVQTATIREAIPKLLVEFNISSMLDAPCGDWYWMRNIVLNIPQYIGVDIVDALIKKNQTLYSRDNVQFKCVNLVKDSIPQAELIFSRDCFVHLAYQDIFAILHQFKASGAKYLLTTTFVDRQHNDDLGEGFWRPLNLQLAPFNFPEPVRIINENCTEENGAFNDKSLALWKLDELLN
ncbi:glycosyltransferase [Candidatus Berkiella aquae]|uniref:Glycosyltransferase n=1 Tax=Candidatus Berkiella aquae TaxID=295108 RepID=A0A0Q9YNG9_9GAMM|nr:glycosyltransferase [Candidatus Berkiella aquae]MCS5712448.1 glycosyltransferase [Candidatus Berkiella aquae]